MVAKELFLTADSDRIHTGVIHAVFGHFSIYSYTVIKFLNIEAYMQTSLSINQQSFLIHSLPHFLLSLSLYLCLNFFLAPLWIAIAERLLDSLRAMRLPQRE